MLRLRPLRSLQILVSIRSSVSNNFNKEHYLNIKYTFKVQREAAPVGWQRMCAEKTDVSFSNKAEFAFD